MKKHYAFLIIFILALNPILASATVSDADENPQPAQVNISENELVTQPNDVPPEPEPVIDNPIPASENNNNDVPEIPKDNKVSDTPNPEDEPKVELPDEPDVEKDLKDDSEDKENDEQTDVKDDAEDDKTEEDDDSITEESEEDEPKVHVHAFKYTGNKDGTHTVTCTEMIKPSEDSEDEASTECTYEEIEACEYDENDICIYCLDKKPEEEFNPSIYISIINRSCVIGILNPVICVNISQDDFDVEYVQICFANYEKQKFINVGLAHGKYLNRKTEEYVYTNDSCWYSSPSITDSYEEGTYTIRSIYARCTNSDYIHYSIESSSLPDELKNISIELLENTGQPEDETEDKTETNTFNFIEDSTVEAHINHNPAIENPPETTNSDEDSIIDNPTHEERTSAGTITDTPITEHPVAEKPVVEQHVAKVPAAEELIAEQTAADSSTIEESTPTEPSPKETVGEENSTEEPEKIESVVEKPEEDLPKEEAVTEAKANTKEEPEQISFAQKIINQFFSFIKRLFRFW